MPKTPQAPKPSKDEISGKAPHGEARSPHWPAVRKAFLVGKKCAVCQGTKKLEAHHIVPFHKDPAKELDPSNLIALCEAGSFGVNCHLFVGHAGDFKGWNPDAASDAKIWSAKITASKFLAEGHDLP